MNTMLSQIVKPLQKHITKNIRQFRKYVRKYSKKHSQSKEKTQSEFQVCTISDCMVDPCKPEPSVVIIGAGIAGLSAAQRLVHCGISNFTILEATERPGGRIHSCWLGDVIAEMGAQYIDGACVGNPIYNLAAQEGLLQAPLKTVDPSKGIFCTSDGRAIDTPISMMAFHVFKHIEHEAASLFNMGCTKDHGSLQNFLGYVGILAPLMKELPESSLKFGKPVGLIRWGAVQSRNKGPRAVVQCCNGEEFCADYVIITVSLGVLKEHGDKLFCPALPANKIEAIKALGYGSVDKVFLDYERPFWVWSNGSIRFAWSQDELHNRTDWTKGLSAVEEVEGSKHVLCAYISGPEAIVMENATDEEVAEGITKVLRQFTGDASLPYPSTVFRSKWASDPYFCGSYSYMNLNSNVGHQCDLSCPVPGACDPVPPILLFAGEATCAGHHSTVHGARLSGIREAERILQLTKRYGGPPPKDCA
ncbi:peroxisomal N(1)-acetyl-spermine/spermidine oxidase isoform X3 [Leptinotarsa decemlineata]|uniref:peroxisomal N(1)-acetyl-spermine/spermidine oxidase isoform X3 n=1 Tax=Leptinotarsa decemlineata TaxID=7539 RepID=UPI003D30BCA4